jgi:hypothetical protein
MPSAPGPRGESRIRQADQPSPNRVGGWLELAPGTLPPDADHEGMADGWKTPSGLDPADPADRNGDFDADGDTNLEDY